MPFLSILSFGEILPETVQENPWNEDKNITFLYAAQLYVNIKHKGKHKSETDDLLRLQDTFRFLAFQNVLEIPVRCHDLHQRS